MQELDIDGRYNVKILRDLRGGGQTKWIFIHNRTELPAHLQTFKFIPKTNILLIGDCDDAVAAFMLDTPNSKLIEYGMTQSTAAKVRKHFGVGQGGRGVGGARRGAGNPNWMKDE